MIRTIRSHSLVVLAVFSGLLAGCEPDSAAESAQTPSCQIRGTPATLPPEITESSGLALGRSDPSVIWTHNDSGDGPNLYAVNAAGQLLGHVRVQAAVHDDWEDLEIAECDGGTCIYIGDIGDNDAARSEVVVYQIPEPRLPDTHSIDAVPMVMRYPTGPRDAEALFVLPGEQIYIVTKGENSSIDLFRYPDSPPDSGPAILDHAAALTTGSVPLADRVTGAAADPTGEWVAIRTYTSALVYRTSDLLGPAAAPVLNVDLRTVGEVQGEGIALGENGVVVISSEGVGEGLPGSISVLQCPL